MIIHLNYTLKIKKCNYFAIRLTNFFVPLFVSVDQLNL